MRVAVTNASADDRWLVTNGQYCDAFAIFGAARSHGYICICECPAPPDATATYYTRVAAGQSTTLEWDARALDDCDEAVDCAQRGWPGAGILQIPAGTLQPATAGAYSITIGYERTPPSATYCIQLMSGDYSCLPPNFSYPATHPAMPTDAICPSAATANAAFTLPSSGDVDVAIAID